MRLRFGAFILDDDRFRLERDGEVVPLRPKVFDLLVLLVRERARVVLRDELVTRLWSTTSVGAGSLSGLVNELRVALGEDARGPSSIRTVHARGYQFVAPVAVEGASGARGRGVTGIDGAAWRRMRVAVERAGAHAWVAVLSERAARRAWLARAMREAMEAGFEVRAASDGSDRSDPLASALADGAALGPVARDAGRVPIALAFEVEQPAVWARAGGLRRLLDLLGRAPVLVLAGIAERMPADPGAGEGGDDPLDDPRVEAVEITRDSEVLAPGETEVSGAADRVGGGPRRGWGPEEPGAGEALGAMAGMLRVLARSDAHGFVAALRTMGFEPAPSAPIRAVRRVEPGRRDPDGRRDAEAS
ncbi:MAG: winged helix-turn-helix domain-containing protein [Myxococcota bacterium]